MQTHEGNSGEISGEELQLLPCWCTKPDDNTWKLEAQTDTVCLDSYTDFAVISPTYSSHSESVGISWSISLKRLLTSVKMTRQGAGDSFISAAMHSGKFKKNKTMEMGCPISLGFYCIHLRMFFHLSFFPPAPRMEKGASSDLTSRSSKNMCATFCYTCIYLLKVIIT